MQTFVEAMFYKRVFPDSYPQCTVITCSDLKADQPTLDVWQNGKTAVLDLQGTKGVPRNGGRE